MSSCSRMRADALGPGLRLADDELIYERP